MLQPTSQEVSLFVIFQVNVDFHQEVLAKHANNNQDTSPLSTSYPDYWAKLMDEGYQDAQQYV